MDVKDKIPVKDNLEVSLCPPSFQDGCYRGTRFDHSGIFRLYLGGNRQKKPRNVVGQRVCLSCATGKSLGIQPLNGNKLVYDR